DYIAYEAAHSRIWVPVGNTGSADVYDTAAGTFTRVDGFKTAEREFKGKKRTMGPSSVSIGDGVAYVGNRGGSEVCAVDLATLKLGKCLKLPSSPDGVGYDASEPDTHCAGRIEARHAEGQDHDQARGGPGGIRGRREPRPVLHEPRGQEQDRGHRRRVA